MNPTTTKRGWLLATVLSITPLLFPLAVMASSDDSSSLRVRVHQIIGESGGVTTVVLRTYAPRDISQGQICMLLPPSSLTGLTPIAGLGDTKVFSGAGDAIGDATLTEEGGQQVLNVVFSSASGSINSVEGALLAIEFNVAASTVVDESFTVEIDPANSLLFDAVGNPLTITPREGDLTIRPAGVPFRVELEGDTIETGEVAELALATFEPFTAVSGQLALTYDAGLFPGTPLVVFDARHGSSAFEVDSSIPGLVLISFESLDASFNSVPGKIVGINLPPAANVPIGTSSAISFDASLTFLVDSAGDLIPLDLQSDQVDFE